MSLFSADPAIKDIAPEKRKCLFPDEESLELFEDYSFSNCILECYIGIASHHLQCIPWYLPRVPGSSLPSCDPWTMIQFQSHMRSIDQAQCGHCLSDCDTVKLSVTTTSNKFRYRAVNFSANISTFRACDSTNLNLSPLCNILMDNNDKEVSK